MTENEYLILDMIIKQGDVLEEDFHKLYREIPLLEFEAGTAFNKLCQLGLVDNCWDEMIGRRYYTATDLGKRLYNERLQKHLDEENLKSKTTEKLNNELKIGQNTIKYWWLPIAISFVALVGSWIIYGIGKSDQSQLQQQIKALDSQLQQTNTRTLYVVDSLWKTGHKPDSSKR